jgi:dihydrofolate reductase
MADLVYTANASLDGYTEDPDGGIDWSTPDEEVFSFIRELERPVGMYLYGRRMYEAMLYWESAIPDERYVRESPTCGGTRTRWCTRAASSRYPVPGRDSSATSTPRPCGA